MPIKKIKISKLKVGMYITGLDISWIRSPFLKHSRLIKKANDIKLLIEAGVKEVTINTDKNAELIKNTDINGTITEQQKISEISNQTENAAQSEAESELEAESVNINTTKKTK
ncbi:MAG: DUF3391 domain-containing protein, partial [Pseudomonadota bacterium]